MTIETFAFVLALASVATLIAAADLVMRPGALRAPQPGGTTTGAMDLRSVIAGIVCSCGLVTLLSLWLSRAGL